MFGKVTSWPAQRKSPVDTRSGGLWGASRAHCLAETESSKNPYFMRLAEHSIVSPPQKPQPKVSQLLVAIGRLWNFATCDRLSAAPHNEYGWVKTDFLSPIEGWSWVAQTDELCEQAVQSFRQVWLNRGAESTDLRISRFWGGNPTPAPDSQGRPVVVVASIQTLNSRVGRDELNWLSSPGLVIIDECHHAIAPSYTGLLRFLDAEASKTGAHPSTEPPVIGLSATPFRSAKDDDETVRLAKRFNQTWLPSGQQELHEILTARGILAKAIHEELVSPSVLPLALIRRFEAAGDLNGFELDGLLDQLNLLLAEDLDRNLSRFDVVIG
jgi:hypothetical protein